MTQARNSGPALSLRQVTRSYSTEAGRVLALNKVSLDVYPGTWTAVMGPSGSGKSTFLHAAAGLERVDSGQVLLGDFDITAAPDDVLTALRREKIGFVFQSFNLVQSLTAAQNVALPLRLAGRRPGHGTISAALSSVGLAERMSHRPRELSGGQQQRVAIARAMVTTPQVLFADEPTGALDSGAAATVLGLLRGMVESGQTVVMVTHDPAAAAHADATLFLRDGCTVDWLAGGSAAQVADRLVQLEA
ncbi:ABC transporter ATP-binding protein [Paenarthrobacter aurescens]|uniref:ABC transporter ATP-binding protein n=1 Tax=Paenarthrobacter aurescens TaxID=43663 RepID=UPI0035E4EB62